MAGNSWLAISQWFIAAEQPPHLAAIAPWEGFTDHFAKPAIEVASCAAISGDDHPVLRWQWAHRGSATHDRRSATYVALLGG